MTRRCDSCSTATTWPSSSRPNGSAGCPILESLLDSRMGGHEHPLTLPLLHDPEPMCEPLDINFLCNDEGTCSLPEVRCLPLSYLQLLSKAAAAGQGRSLQDLRARA